MSREARNGFSPFSSSSLRERQREKMGDDIIFARLLECRLCVKGLWRLYLGLVVTATPLLDASSLLFKGHPERAAPGYFR